MVCNRQSERGSGRAGTVFALLVLGALIYLGMKYIPVMVNAYSLRDYIEEEARYAAVRKGDEDIRDRIYQKARELTLPVQRTGIKVQRGTNEVTIQVSYTVPIETPVFTHKWKFQERSSAPLF